MKLPHHLAIIMDGNGRWAQKRKRPRVYGHIKGAIVARDTISACARLGIKYLTLYTFSTENWKRPAAEVSFLMKLLERHLKRERKKLIKENIKFHCLGDLSRLPSSVINEIQETLRATENNTGMQLVFALNYGGRQEIVDAAKALALRVKNNEITIQDINEESFRGALDGSFFPDPDLIIRTSGEQRLSNFLTWQSAYSELYITQVLWPDFNEDELLKAIYDFNGRQRRYGALEAQPENP